MKKFLLLTAALAAPALIIAGCGRKETSSASSVEEPAADAGGPEIGTFGLAVKDIDAAVAPGDDFYAYVNGDWLKSFKIPEEYSSYGSFTVLAERSEERLKAIIEGLSSSAPGGDARRVRDFYQSYLDTAAIEAKALAPLAEDFAAIDALATPGDLARHFADPAIRARAPITFVIGTDLKRPDRYALYAGQSGLGMPNRDYYLEQKFADKQVKYQAYIETMLRLAGHSDPAGAAARIYALELEMAKVHWEPAKRRNRDLMYNLKTIDELQTFAPGAPWRTMLAAAGLDDRAEVIVREDDAVAKLAAMIAAAPIETWRDYLKFHLLNANADVLPSAFDAANFAFYGTELRGTPKQKERWKRAVAAVDASLGEAVGKLDPDRPPWIFHQELSTRLTRNPTTFDEAFRQIGRRQVGGGPKTTPADELLFCGNLGSGILFLTSRVRLVDPNESFYTSSNHRLRDSHVGRAGHWVDIAVLGECSDADLALIQCLAQGADTRPVVVRHIAPLARRTGTGGAS